MKESLAGSVCGIPDRFVKSNDVAVLFGFVTVKQLLNLIFICPQFVLSVREDTDHCLTGLFPGTGPIILGENLFMRCDIGV